ncbi:MAG: helix-turn-helix transcriptional regulator [Bacilli bacterium]|nr:helix-turn-helix transcriptional regulator [Bacilli bacterium]
MPNEKEDVQLFASRLRDALEYKKMTAAELSRKSGIDQAAISRYKKGLYAPNRNNIFLLARALGVNPTWLLGFSNDMLYQMSEKEAARNELENLIVDMDLDQIKKTIAFLREYILK